MANTFDVIKLTHRSTIPKSQIDVLANSEGHLSITYAFDGEETERIELGVYNVPALIDMLTSIKDFMDARKGRK